jgi:cell division septation protein DedD
MKKHRVLLCMAAFVLTGVLPALNAQSAKSVVSRAAAASASGEKTLSAVIKDVEQAAQTAQGADKRALYAFLGDLKEKAGYYDEASRDYAAAAGIAAGTAEGMPRVSAEQLVISAIRCSLSAGDYESAESYLASRVKDSADPATAASVRLYSVWCRLSRAETPEAMEEPLALLRSYSTNSAMDSVRPVVLLSIWYIDSDQKSADTLLAQYPNSPETAIVKGQAALLPAPFWYFTPRKNMEFAAGVQGAPIQKAAPPVSKPPAPAPVTQEAPSGIKKAVRQQLGIFRSEDYANSMTKRLSAEGFNAVVRQETRNDALYYVVFVPENSEGNMGARLRAAGFECYPIYE